MRGREGEKRNKHELCTNAYLCMKHYAGAPHE